jgi:glycosyltransferase involved in cell wall biosynthesis
MPHSGAGIVWVTVVTPVYNGAAFIRETVESVLSQDYPYLEYLVLDAGSTDGTVAILEEYAGRLSYRVAPDNGTADAVNRGFRAARGGICAWLSADDLYLPGTISAVVAEFGRDPDAGVVFGRGDWIDERKGQIGPYPVPMSVDRQSLARECVLCQPACFARRDSLADIGYLDDRLKSAFDYDLWIRLAAKYRFRFLDRLLAQSRMHRANKSLGQKELMFEESIELLRRHFGYVPVQWIYGRAAHREQGTDQFFEPIRRSPAAYLRALAEGWSMNRLSRGRYVREWFAIAARGVLRAARDRKP